VRRHSTDPVALLAGALFITVGAAYLGGALSDTNIEARWVLPTVLIALGFAGLLVSLVNLARQRRTAGVAAQPVGSGTAPAGPGADTTATMPLEAMRPETMPSETAQPVTAQPETTEPETTEPETVETETVEPQTESPEAEPPRTTPLETSPVESDNEPGDEPRDRS
jgi:outer membrane biosynthesis protein TonB